LSERFDRLRHALVELLKPGRLLDDLAPVAKVVLYLPYNKVRCIGRKLDVLGGVVQIDRRNEADISLLSEIFNGLGCTTESSGHALNEIGILKYDAVSELRLARNTILLEQSQHLVIGSPARILVRRQHTGAVLILISRQHCSLLWHRLRSHRTRRQPDLEFPNLAAFASFVWLPHLGSTGKLAYIIDRTTW